MTGLLLYLGILLAVRIARRCLDRGWLFRFIARRTWHEPTLDARLALEEAGIRPLSYSPPSMRFEYLTLAVWTVGGAATFGIQERLQPSIWLTATLLSTLYAASLALDFLTIRAKGYDPISGTRGAREWAFLAPAILARIALSTLGFVMAYRGIDAWNGAHPWLGLAWMLASVLPLGFAHVPVVLADRAAHRTFRHADFASGTATDSALLLRSFADDQLRLVSALTSTGPAAPQLNLLRTRFEEVVALAMIGAGPLVAIGRPGERLPELGAARTYWADEDWQRAVEETAYRAERVIMIAGLTQGLAWEIGKLREWGMLRKLLVLVPPDNPERSSARIERIVADLGIEEFPNDELLSPMVIGFGFDRDARPIVYLADGPTWDAYLWAVIVQHQLLTGAQQLPSLRSEEKPRPESAPAPAEPSPGSDATRAAVEPSQAAEAVAEARSARRAVAVPTIPEVPQSESSQLTRYGAAAISAMLDARWEAKRIGHDLLAPPHLLLSVVAREPELAQQVLGRSSAEVRDAVLANMPPGYSMAPDPRPSSEPFQRYLRHVPSVADSLGHEQIEVSDLLLALLHPVAGGPMVASALAELGVNAGEARRRGGVDVTPENGHAAGLPRPATDPQ